MFARCFWNRFTGENGNERSGFGFQFLASPAGNQSFQSIKDFASNDGANDDGVFFTEAGQSRVQRRMFAHQIAERIGVQQIGSAIFLH